MISQRYVRGADRMNGQILLSTPTDSTIARATDVAAPNSTAPSRTCSSAQMLEFTRADLSDADLDRLRRTYKPLTQSVRELIDATIRTEVDAATVADVTAQIDAATARLRSTQLPGPFGVRYTHEGNGMAWGNPVIGTRNPIAPPLVLNYDESGTICCRYLRATRLGALHTEAVIERTEGVKTFAVGHLADDEGITVEAEGV